MAAESRQDASPEAAAEPARPGPWWRDLLVLAAVAVLLLLRRPDVAAYPQLWAEDGTVFLAGQREQGVASLFFPHAGYLLLLPRLMALFAGALPLSLVPAAYVWSSLAVTLLVALFVLRCRVALPFRPLFALAIPLIPHRGDVFLTPTNIQWVTAGALALLLLQERARTRAQAVADVLLALLLGLTGPFSLLFLPLVAYRLFRDRGDRATLAVCAAAVAAAVVQGVTIATHPEPSQAPATDAFAWAYQILGVFPGRLLLGPVGAAFVPGDVLLLLGLIAFGLVGLSLWKAEPGRRVLAGLLCLVGLLIYGAALRKWAGEPAKLDPFVHGQRYYYAAYLLVVWGLLVLAGAKNAAVRWVGRVAAVLAVIAALPAYRYLPMTRYGWSEYARRVEQGETVTAPINPAGWEVTLSPPRK